MKWQCDEIKFTGKIDEISLEKTALKKNIHKNGRALAKIYCNISDLKHSIRKSDFEKDQNQPKTNDEIKKVRRIYMPYKNIHWRNHMRAIKW